MIAPLHRFVPLDRVSVASYQAISGAGRRAIAEHRDRLEDPSIEATIFGTSSVDNVFSHESPIDPKTGYNEEELKLIFETRKILHAPELRVTATCVRVPVVVGHSIAVDLSFREPVDEEKIRELLAEADGVIVCDDRTNNRFPEPRHVHHELQVSVGRIRQDLSQPTGIGYSMFISGDNLIKGAAGNAVQILQCMLR